RGTEVSRGTAVFGGSQKLKVLKPCSIRTASAKIMKNVPRELIGNNPNPNARKAPVRTREAINALTWKRSRRNASRRAETNSEKSEAIPTTSQSSFLFSTPFHEGGQREMADVTTTIPTMPH